MTLPNNSFAMQQALQSATIQEFLGHGRSLSGQSFGFPSNLGYSYYSPQWVWMMSDRAIRLYHSQGIWTRETRDDGTVVGLRATATIEAVISFLALTRMGHAVLVVGPNLPPDGLQALVDEANCKFVVNGMPCQDYVSIPLASLQLLLTDLCGKNDEEILATTYAADEVEPAILIHTSGTTGKPKLIRKTHQSFMAILRGIPPEVYCKTILVGSWMHWVAGLSLMLLAFVRSGSRTCWLSEEYECPAESINEALMEIRPDIISCNSSFLIPASETAAALDLLKRCLLVINIGGVLPPHIANRLTGHGVRLSTAYGMTEVPISLSSVANAGDSLYWDYVQPEPSIAPHLHFQPLEETANSTGAESGDSRLHELIILSSFPSLDRQWANAPDGSLHTGDIFIKHPLTESYRCLGRTKNEIRLIPNSTDVITIRTRPYEDFIEKLHQEFVDAAFVFGDERPKPGILLFLKPSTTSSDETVKETIWKNTNFGLERLLSAGLTKDLLFPIRNIAVPRTVKGDVARAQLLLQFDTFIDEVYITNTA